MVSWLLPARPNFSEDGVVEDSFLHRLLSSIPVVGGFLTSRRDLRRCELKVRNLEQRLEMIREGLGPFLSYFVPGMDNSGAPMSVGYTWILACLALVGGGISFKFLFSKKGKISDGKKQQNEILRNELTNKMTELERRIDELQEKLNKRDLEIRESNDLSKKLEKQMEEAEEWLDEDETDELDGSDYEDDSDTDEYEYDSDDDHLDDEEDNMVMEHSYEDISKQMEEAEEERPVTRRNVLESEMDRCIHKQEFDSALVFLRVVLEDFDDVECRVKELRCLMALGRWDEAQNVLDELPDEHKVNSDVRVESAILCASHCDFEEAERILDKVLKGCPNHPRALKGREFLQRQVLWNTIPIMIDNSEFESVLETISRCQKLESFFPWARAELLQLKGNILCKLRRLEEARECFLSALAIDETDVLTRLRLGLCYLLDGKYRDAIALFEQLDEEEELEEDLVFYAEALERMEIHGCPFKTINVKTDASQKEIEKAYRKMALKYHPDKCHGSDIDQREVHEIMQHINYAKDLLTDKEKREEYNDVRKFVEDFAEELFENPKMQEWLDEDETDEWDGSDYEDDSDTDEYEYDSDDDHLDDEEDNMVMEHSYEDISKQMEEAEEERPVTRRNVLESEMDRCIHKQEFDSALVFLRVVLEDFDDVECRVKELRCLMALGRWDEAQNVLDELPDEHKVNSDVRVESAILCASHCDFEEAERILDKVLKGCPNHPRALKGREFLQRQVLWNTIPIMIDNSEFESVLETISRCQKLESFFPWARAELLQLKGNILCKLRRLEEARECFLSALAIDETDVLTRLRLGLCYLLDGKYRDAIALFEQLDEEEELEEDLVFYAEALERMEIHGCPFKTINVKTDASQKEIEKAYRKMALKYHPDKCHGSDIDQREVHEIMQHINYAKDLLTDKEKREEYNDVRKFVEDFAEELFENPKMQEWLDEDETDEWDGSDYEDDSDTDEYEYDSDDDHLDDEEDNMEVSSKCSTTQPKLYGEYPEGLALQREKSRLFLVCYVPWWGRTGASSGEQMVAGALANLQPTPTKQPDSSYP
ncbi:myosin-2-like [Palaemon carinicauda]|uniref:myosin-2-like n=1 Tax=Palaemon carinicauda TaxID=392227 RepID=UPI0035B61F9A